MMTGKPSQGEEAELRPVESGPCRRGSSLPAKLFLGVLAFVVGLLLVEGVISLVAGRSLRGLVRTWRGPLDVRTLSDADRWQAAPPPGLFRVHPDPLVGYVFRPEATLEILGAGFRTDRLGMRIRPGPPPPGNAMRIIVLGDSVAFGVGVHDNEMLAYRLEEMLLRVRGKGERPVTCYTVAVPGWNNRNSVHFLLDHMDVWKPDIVLFLPVGNDLTNTDGVYETGHRRVAPDIATRDPWLAYTDNSVFLARTGVRLFREGRQLDTIDIGTLAAGADITPVSRCRFDDNAAMISELARCLAARGAKLLLVQYRDQGLEDAYHWILRERLADLGLHLPVVSLFTKVTRSLALPTDPHPNPKAFRIAAIWTCEYLLDHGLVSRGENRPLPAVPESFEAKRSRGRTPAEIRALARGAREKARRRLLPEVNMETGRGIGQVVGGVSPEGSAGARTMVILAPEGDHIRGSLAPVPGRPDLYPLEVAVEVNGIPAGIVMVSAGNAEARTRFDFALPEREDVTAPIEVVLKPKRWVVMEERGVMRIVSFRPIRLVCERR